MKHQVRDISQFMAERPSPFSAALELDGLQKLNPLQTILLIGALKAGKREVIEALATIRSQTSKVTYCVSLDRHDMADQYDEMRDYNINVLRLGCAGVLAQIPNFNRHIHNIVARDENEYGDKKNQKYSKLRYHHAGDNISWVETSATPFSLMEVVARNGNIPYVVLLPPTAYNGLDKIVTRVIITEPFCNIHSNRKHIISFSSTFERAVEEWLKLGIYPIFIVRDTSFPVELQAELQDKIRKLQLRLGYKPKINVKVVHKDNSKDFSWERDNWDSFELIVVKQTFTRGTETNVHEKLFGYYDHRNDKTTLATLLQALGRFCGYRPNSHIRLYLHQDGINYIDAYNYMWDGLYNKMPIANILSDMHTKYGIIKFSDTVKLTTPTTPTIVYQVFNSEAAAKQSSAKMYQTIPSVSSISANWASDLADDLARNKNRHGFARVFHIDGPATKATSFNAQGSWNYLMSVHPNWKGLWVHSILMGSPSIISGKNNSVYPQLDQQGLL